MSREFPGKSLRQAAAACIVGSLAACATGPLPPDTATRPVAVQRAPAGPGPRPSTPASDARDHQSSPLISVADSPLWQWLDLQPLPGERAQPRSRWVPVRWGDLPGWGHDSLHEAWVAWLRSCERPATVLGGLCDEVRQRSIASEREQHEWVMQRLQPYRVLDAQGGDTGLLTGYFEPELDARREPDASHRTPLFAPPADLARQRPWYTREQIDTLPEAQSALQGKVIAWLSDPIDALLLQIQGSGRLLITEPDGQQRHVRLAFAAHNGHPYRSVGAWLRDREGLRDVSWDAIRAWVAEHPSRASELLWSNPRTVFFREEVLGEDDMEEGPRGAQGVALTPGRSIAVDRDSIPYGTPVWMASSGPASTLERLVMAQDTGGAIRGAVRADFFTGWGAAAYQQAATLKQPLRLWALWPRPGAATVTR